MRNLQDNQIQRIIVEGNSTDEGFDDPGDWLRPFDSICPQPIRHRSGEID